jgi:hypothetical protein
MLTEQRSAPTASTTTTPIVTTVDRVTDAHLTLSPSLPRGGYVVAVYTGDTLAVLPQFATADVIYLSWLHTAAQRHAQQHGYRHDVGCRWCLLGNCADRDRHAMLDRGSETTWRRAAA